MQYRLISADSHVIEPPDVFEKGLPAGLKGRAPRFAKQPDGGDAWVVEGQDAVPLPRSAVSGSEYRGLGLSPAAGIGFDDILPALSDPKERLKAQDEDSVDAEILYPFPGLWDAIKNVDDPEIKLACVRAYNDWIAEFSAVSPGRLIGLGKIPVTGTEDAVAELKRCAEELKLKGVVLDFLPHGGESQPEPEDKRFWEAAEALGVPVSIHYGLGHSRTVPPPVAGPGKTPPMFDIMMPLAASGAFDDFPGLKIVMSHGNSGWVPYALENMDNRYLRSVATRQISLVNPDLMPSDYGRRFFWFTFQNDRVAVANRERLGVAHMMWGSHFPLGGSDWPDNRARAEAVTHEVPAEDKERLLAGNCGRLYRMPGFEQGFSPEELTDYRQLIFI